MYLDHIEKRLDLPFLFVTTTPSSLSVSERRSSLSTTVPTRVLPGTALTCDREGGGGGSRGGEVTHARARITGGEGGGGGVTHAHAFQERL